MRSSSKPPDAAKLDISATAEHEAPTIDNVTGRVEHDDRGTAIWQWALTTGAHMLESATQRIRKLDNPTLSLLDESHPKSGRVRENPRGTVQGYSPYDSGLLAREEGSRKKDLRKLSEWLKLKKQAAARKPDE